MKIKSLIKISLFLAVTVLSISCSKNEIIPEDVEINDFVWGGMNAYYKWQGNVKDLADTKFSNRDELNEYLDGFDSPTDLFNSLLYQDTASEITSDYTNLEDALDGYITTNGLKFDSRLADDASSTYVYVYDVIEGSSAANVGITRGMIFTQANGATITSNNIATLFSAEIITLVEADYNNGIPIANGNVYTISESEIQENAIGVTATMTSGTENVGYLMYNHFSEDYVDELNIEFANFKADAIDQLIVDLRYNSGRGSIETAAYLGSMITGQFTDQVFSKQIWNDKVMSNLSNSNISTYFTDEIVYDTDETEFINSLKLSTVYFIISDQTDAASLLLINSLAAYIDVVLVGEQTGSNHLVSTILYDSDDYTKKGSNFNSSHTWAIQPIVFEVQNKNNTNTSTGYTPDAQIKEDPSNLGVLGSITEPLLARTLTYITNGAKSSVTTGNKTISDTEDTLNSNSLLKLGNTMFFSF